MIKIFNVVRNEITRFLNEKKLYIIFAIVGILVILGTLAYKDMINNIATGDIRSTTYSEEFKVILQNFNGLSFSKMFLTDFIYKPYFSIYLIFIAIIAVNVFSNDYKSGNLKFTLLTNISTTQIYIGKILFMVLVSLMIVTLNLLLSLIAGEFAFGGKILLSDLFSVAFLYFIAIIPAVAFSLIISLVSLAKLNSNIILGSSIGAVILFGLLDALTKFKYISPIGILSFFEVNIPQLSYKMLISCGISLGYIIILSLLLINISKKMDYSI